MEWISVDDRLPEVIHTLRDGDSTKWSDEIIFVIETGSGPKRFVGSYFFKPYFRVSESSEEMPLDMVTHWQPLPDPPTPA